MILHTSSRILAVKKYLKRMKQALGFDQTKTAISRQVLLRKMAICPPQPSFMCLNNSWNVSLLPVTMD